LTDEFQINNRKAKSIKANRKESDASDKLKISPKEMAKARYALPFPDTEEIRKAFEILKARLSSAPVLMHPDFEQEFILYTDVCRKGIGARLYQVSLEDNKLYPILFISRQLKDAETRYLATELKCLELVWSLPKLQHYIDGAKLKIYTDHAALKWIWNVKATVNSCLFHRALLLNPLRDKITIIHRPGRFHANADALSRFPSSSSSPSSFNVNLVHVDNDWQEELWSGYNSDRHFKNIVLRLVRRTQNVSVDEQTAPVADSTTSKATPTDTSNSNLTADALTSAQTSASDPSTPTPMSDRSNPMHVDTAAFHPQADGQSEWTNATVKIALRCFLGGDENLYPKWTEYLPIIELEYNNIPQASTNISPNDLHFAIHPRGIPDVLSPLDSRSSESTETLAGDLQNRRSDARDSILAAQRKQKELYDSKRRDFQFKVGDLALLRFHRFGSGYKPPSLHHHKIAPISTSICILEKLSPLWSERVTFEGKRLVVGTEINRTEFSLAS